jgi:Glycosyl hydrolases family 43
VQNGADKYFVWSGWPSFTDGQQNLYIAPMSNPWTISGERVLLATPDFAWERHGLPINEGPEALYHNGLIHIIYSASGFWTDEYCLGQITFNASGSILNRSSWTKKSSPVFAKTSQVVGVGHASFTRSPNGLEDWIVYHAHNNPTVWTGVRDVRAQPFSWMPDGSPNFGTPQLNTPEPGGTPQFVSSLMPGTAYAPAEFTRSPFRVGLAKAGSTLGMLPELAPLEQQIWLRCSTHRTLTCRRTVEFAYPETRKCLYGT